MIKPFATMDAMQCLMITDEIQPAAPEKEPGRKGVETKWPSILQPKSSLKSVLLHERPKLTQALFKLQNLLSCSADIFEAVL